MGVHYTRNSAVVDMSIPLADILDGRDALFLRLVRQHSTEGDVTDHTNVGDLSAVLLVDDDTAALVSLNSNVLKAETGGVGPAADSNEDNVGINLKGI